MLLLRVYEKWRGISFLVDHFSAVARRRKLCVLILVHIGSVFVSMCCFYCCVVDNIYLWYCVEYVIFCHEVTDALAEVTKLDVDAPQEGPAFPLSHYHDCFRVHFGQIERHGKP